MVIKTNVWNLKKNGLILIKTKLKKLKRNIITEINLRYLKKEERNNYKAIIGTFSIYDTNNSSNKLLSPEIRIYNKPETLTYESSIRSRLSHDLYLTMSNINRSDFYNIKFQKKPFMLWIWFSAILIAFGGFIRFFKMKEMKDV